MPVSKPQTRRPWPALAGSAGSGSGALSGAAAQCQRAANVGVSVSDLQVPDRRGELPRCIYAMSSRHI